jgi:hypothetical protein
MRAFARALKVDHSALSQMLLGKRRITARTIRAWGPHLGLTPRQVRECCELEHEAAILAALAHKRFRTSSRWLAVTLNIPLDDINIALQSLLRKRLLVMRDPNVWHQEKRHG